MVASCLVATVLGKRDHCHRQGVGEPDNQLTKRQGAIGISGSAIPVMSVSGAAMVMVQLDCLDNSSSLH